MIEIPKTNCEGCDSRDRMIAILSERIDELEKLRDESTELMAEAVGKNILEFENGRT